MKEEVSVWKCCRSGGIPNRSTSFDMPHAYPHKTMHDEMCIYVRSRHVNNLEISHSIVSYAAQTIKPPVANVLMLDYIIS